MLRYVYVLHQPCQASIVCCQHDVLCVRCLCARRRCHLRSAPRFDKACSPRICSCPLICFEHHPPELQENDSRTPGELRCVPQTKGCGQGVGLPFLSLQADGQDSVLLSGRSESSIQNSTNLRPDSGLATSNGSICDVPEATSSLDGGTISTLAGATYLAAGMVSGTRPNSIQAHSQSVASRPQLSGSMWVH